MVASNYVFYFHIKPESGVFDEYNGYNYHICKILDKVDSSYVVQMKYSTSYDMHEILRYPDTYLLSKERYEIPINLTLPIYFVPFTYEEALQLIGMHLTYEDPVLNIRHTTVITEVKEQDGIVYINGNCQQYYINNKYYTMAGVPFGKPTINKPNGI